MLAAPPASAQGVHADEAIGFQVRPPRGWKQIPMRPDESYLVGKYQAEDAERVLDPKTGRQLVHTPEILIVAFLDSSIEGVPKQKTRYGKKYRNFKDFLEANYSQGYFVEEEEEDEHDGRPVTKLSIQVEAKISYTAKRIIAWEYETEVGTVAVSYEVAEEAFKDHRNDVTRMMRSFKLIPRTEEIRLGVRETDFVSSDELKQLTPDERKEYKLKAYHSEWENMAAALPDGWDALEINDVLVVSHADKKHAKEVVQHIRNLYEWLNESFEEVGGGEFARYPLVRICKDRKEERAFREGSGTYGVSGTHLVTYEGDKNADFSWEYIGGRTYAIWFLERDRELYYAMPRWLSTGLYQLARNTTSKGSKLRFSDAWWKQFIPDDLPKADDMMEISRLFMLSKEEFDAYGKRQEWTPWYQSVLLTQFFVESKRNRVVLADYLVNLRQALDELQAQEEGDGERPKPKNEEEEAALRKEREARIEKRERQLLDRAFQLTFEDWDTGDWLSLQRSFGRSL